ncbi:MAG: response regulator transcription factor [Chloroflexota bacterium]|nr:response regulator transcription factor [Chloroflexota bacterium]
MSSLTTIEPTRPARVLIVDDHELVRSGLRGMLSGERDLQVVGEAASGGEAIVLCRTEHPNVVLMDVRMPGMDGLEATRAIKREMPRTTVLMVTMQENPDYLYQALEAGASGYLLKDASRSELVTAVRSVLSGEPLLAPQMTGHLLRRLKAEQRVRTGCSVEPLTPREVEVLRLVAEGLTNREIGQTLGLSAATIKVHVQHIIAKLGVSDRTQAAVRAVELGLVGAE